MDSYTIETKKWLEKRFSEFGEDEAYSFQYDWESYDKSNAEFYLFNHAIINKLLTLEFDRFIDIGSAEGQIPAIVSRKKSIPPVGLDLSYNALKKGKKLFNLHGIVGDINDLPIRSGSIDLVFSCNTLEHIPNPERSISELYRIARHTLVIIVPAKWRPNSRDLFCDPAPDTPHKHLHFFSVTDFQRMLSSRHLVFEGIAHKILYYLAILATGRETSDRQRRKFSKSKLMIYKLLKPLNSLMGKNFLKILIFLDRYLSKLAKKDTSLFFITTRKPASEAKKGN